jgi:PEP-CTERM motif
MAAIGSGATGKSGRGHTGDRETSVWPSPAVRCKNAGGGFTMKYVLLLLLAIPSLADSITPPVTSVAFSGVNTAGSFFTSPTDYLIGGGTPNTCSECLGFQVQDGVFTGSSTNNFAGVTFTNGPEGAGAMFGHLGKVTFNPQTDVLSALFGGKEQMETMVAGKWWPIYWYSVTGKFSENLGTGVASLNLTHETFVGTTAVPEPSTWAMLATGIAAIGMGWRWFPKSTSRIT